MFNTTLFGPRNLLVIAVFALLWQVIFSRVNLYLHKNDAATEAA